MTNEELAKSLYPEAVRDSEEDSYFWAAVNYQPILAWIGAIALQVDDHDYQGDSRVMYRDGQRVGLLIFGWGSCSGCDALQACDSWAEVGKLAEGLKARVQWFDCPVSALKYFTEKDWELDYSWHADETKQFVEQAKAYLQSAV